MAAVVTGAGSGIGKALAQLLAKNGVKVFGVDKNAAALKAVKAENITTITADIGTAKGVDALKKAVGKEAVKILALVAGSLTAKPLLSIDRTAYDTMVSCNQSAPIFVTQALVENLKAADGARIILTFGGGVDTHIPTFGGYGSTKAAMKTLWLALRDECAAFAGVALVSPGLVKTALWEACLKDPNWPLASVFGPRFENGDCHTAEEVAEWMEAMCDSSKVQADTFRTKEWCLDNPAHGLEVKVNETAEMKAMSNKAPDQPLKVGDLVEALFDGKGSRWFEAKVVEIKENSLKVKWTYDDDVPESEVTMENVKINNSVSIDNLYIVGEKSARLDLLKRIKMIDTGKGHEEVSLTSGVVHMCARDDARQQQYSRFRSAAAGAGLENDVMGLSITRAGKSVSVTLTSEDIDEMMQGRGRQVGEIPDLYKGERLLRADSGDSDSIGWTLLPLLNDGELKGKVVGKQGAMRIKIQKACGSGLGYVDNTAYIYGTKKERERTSAILNLIQVSSGGLADGVPPEVEDICTRVTLPDTCERALVGPKRATMNALEDETGTMSVWVPTPPSTEPETVVVFEEGMTVEGKFEHKKGDRWFECTITEVKKGEDGNSTFKVKWTYDPDEISEVAQSFLRKVGEGKKAEMKTLAIFGTERNRKLAELQVMRNTEKEAPGTFSNKGITSEQPGFATEAMQLSADDAARCKGSRVRSIEKATNCIIVSVGDTVFFAGTGAERGCAREYVKWLSTEKPSVCDVEMRVDVSTLLVPSDKCTNLSEYVREGVELETKTFSFFDEGAGVEGIEGNSRLLVLGADDANRAAAIERFTKLQDEKPMDTSESNKRSWTDDSKDRGAQSQTWEESKKDQKTWGDSSERKSSSENYSRSFEPSDKKRKVEYVVESAEEERRRKRADRFK